MQVIQSGIIALTASVMTLFLILISPILFTDAENTGDYVELALPLVAILFFYLAFRFFREALILRFGTRYLVVDRNFLFQGGFFGFMKTTRVFVLRYVSALRADRGMPPTLRTLSRRRAFAAPYEWECLSFQYQDENVMIAGIKAAEAAWLKNKIEQIPKGS